MTLLQIKINLFLLIIASICSCQSNKHSAYYNKDIKDWENYLLKINNHEFESLKNSILLVLKSSECSPTLEELKWWDEYRLNNPDTEIKLIILDPYPSRFQVFLNHFEINIPAYRDSSGIVLKENLLPETPMKVFIDGDGVIKKIAAIDIQSDEEGFVPS